MNFERLQKMYVTDFGGIRVLKTIYYVQYFNAFKFDQVQSKKIISFSIKNK